MWAALARSKGRGRGGSHPDPSERRGGATCCRRAGRQMMERRWSRALAQRELSRVLVRPPPVRRVRIAAKDQPGFEKVFQGDRGCNARCVDIRLSATVTVSPQAVL